MDDVRSKRNTMNETRWILRSIGRPHDQLRVLVAVDTRSETVCRAIEKAAADNGIVLERVEEEE